MSRGQYVGDKDLRTLMRSYVRERPEEPQRAVMEMEHTGRPVHDSPATRNADATKDRQSGPVEELTLE